MNGKLDTARVFERIFKIYGDQFTLLIPAALLLFVPVALLNALILAGGSVLALLLTAAIATIATYWYQGMVVEAARDILDGRRDHTIGSLFESALPLIGPLLLAGILAGIGIAIGLLLLGGASDDSFAGYAIAELVVRVVVVPLSAIAAAVMYLELRPIQGEPLAEESGVVPPPAPERPAP